VHLGVITQPDFSVGILTICMHAIWDPDKNEENIEKHHVSFEDARRAWLDPHRAAARDVRHSGAGEQRYYLFGKVSGEVLAVRFTRRGDMVRIIGAGYWREGRDRYEQLNAFRR
jgi:uncharacterized protein